MTIVEVLDAAGTSILTDGIYIGHEGDTLKVSVKPSTEPRTESVTVDIGVVDEGEGEGIAIEGTDFDILETSLTFPVGSTAAKTFTVKLHEDDEAENAETFKVEVKNPRGDEATVSADSQAEIQIGYDLIEVDLDIIDPEGNEISDDMEVDEGEFIVLNDDDSDRDGVIDLDDRSIEGGDEDLLELKLHKLQNADQLAEFGGGFKLRFDSDKLRIWGNREKTSEYFADSSVLKIDRDHTLFVEGILRDGIRSNNDNAKDIEIKAEYVPEENLPPHFISQGSETEDVVNVSFRERADILLAIGGTGSRAWLEAGGASFPNQEGRTVGGRWLSHLRNFADSYGDDPDIDKTKFEHGPDNLVTGSDSPDIIDKGYKWVSEQYWNAVRTGAEPKVDLLGMSRGGFIASEIAHRIANQGYGFRPQGVTNDFGREVRFLGLYDPVDQAFALGDFITPIGSVPSNVQHSALGVATFFNSFWDGSTSNEFSRHYWNRVEYDNASETKLFRATHSAFQGAPTYSTDPGTLAALTTGGAANWAGSFVGLGGSTNLVTDHPSAWLDGYTDALDVQGSIEVDTWFRTQAMSVGVPIEVLSAADYQFNDLLPDPNPESPNHDVGYSE